MKKLLIGLLGVFLFIGNAVAQNESLEFEIDPVATANAPWKVGERTWEDNRTDTSDREHITFLGITTDGKVIIQQFYASGNKYTDPFAVPSITHASIPGYPQQCIDSLYTQWYENGQRRFMGTFREGQKYGLWTGWSENGQKSSEGHFENNKEVGLWTYWYDNGQKSAEWYYNADGKPYGLWQFWDEDGNLIREVNY